MSNWPPSPPPPNPGDDDYDYGISYGQPSAPPPLPTGPYPPAPPPGYGPVGPPGYGQPPAGPPPGYGQQPPGPPPGYGEQPYGLPPQGTPDPRAYANPYYGPGAFTSREHPQAVMILVFGILSVVLCPLFAPVAWSMGAKARRDIRFSGVRYTNEGLVTAGWIMGLIVSSLMIAFFVFFILLALAGNA